MAREIRGRYSGGVVLPLEDLDLEEGAEVVIAPIDNPESEAPSADDVAEAERKRKAFLSSFGGWKGMHDPDELIRMIYEARRTGSRPACRPGRM